jgi:hypothetical protein
VVKSETSPPHRSILAPRNRLREKLPQLVMAIIEKGPLKVCEIGILGFCSPQPSPSASFHYRYWTLI